MKNYLFAPIIVILLFFSSCNKEKSFTIVLLPDTQMYAEKYPEIFRAQTEWIAEHAGDISFVLQQGDITNKNTEEQWEVAAGAFGIFDGKVPYILAPGNHDTGLKGRTDKRNTDLFNHYFPYSKYSKSKGFAGAFHEGEMDNVYYIFEAGGRKWLVLSLEFGPRNEVLDWAGEVIRNHPKHLVIINTHAYLYSDDTRMGPGKDHKWLPETYGVGKDTGKMAVNNGEEIWNKLAGKYENVLFVFSGHVLNDGTGKLVSKGVNGNLVYQMLANYQGGVKGAENGGNGYLRIINVNVPESMVSVKTYSPWINNYKTESDQEFNFSGVDFSVN